MVIVLKATSRGEARPFVFDGRAYQRMQSTTSVMPQDRYEQMLLERAHARRRWENQPAVDVGIDDLDHEEILRTRERYGIAPPIFEEQDGALYVTFRAQIGPEQATGTAAPQVTGEVTRLAWALGSRAMSRKEAQAALGLKHEDHFRSVYLVPALKGGIVEMTVPDKPKSRLQRYRLTAKGRSWLASVKSSESE